MNRHYQTGFQRSFINDLYHVEPLLQEYDEYLYIMWNPTTNEHLVMDGLMEMAIMKIPQKGYEVLNSRVVDRIKQIHTYNGFSAIHEIEQSEARRERDLQKETDDLAYNWAKDMERPVKELSYYGRV